MNQKIFLFFAAYIIVVYVAEYLINMETTMDWRIEQSNSLLKDSAFKEKFIAYQNKHGKHLKKYKIETSALQAGINIEYGEWMFRRLVIGLGVGFVVGLLLLNPFIGLIFVWIGSLLPNIVLEKNKKRRNTNTNEQVGPFMFMLIKRYESKGNLKTALELTLSEYEGIEPMRTEIEKTLSELTITSDPHKSLNNLARRTGSVHLQLFADYFDIAYTLGSEEGMLLLTQAYEQYEEDRQLKELLTRELEEVVKESYLMIGMIPVLVVFSIFQMPGFLTTIRTNLLGKGIITIVVLIFLFCLWLVNKHINAPLE